MLFVLSVIMLIVISCYLVTKLTRNKAQVKSETILQKSEIATATTAVQKREFDAEATIKALNALQPSPRSLKIAENRRKREAEKMFVPEGAFTNMASLLAGLDDTFSKLSRLSGSNPIQRTLKKFGPFIMSWGNDDDPKIDGGFQLNKLEGFDAYGLPAFLFGNIPPREKDGENHQFLFWAMKTTKVPHIRQSPGWTYYEFGHIFPKGGKYPEMESTAFVGVHEQTGVVMALPQLSNWKEKLSVNGKRAKWVPRYGWRHVPMSDYASDFRGEKLAKSTAMLFALLYSMVMRRELGCNVVVTKDDCKATFLVPENQWKHFFKGRVDVEGKDGKKQRIFHAVKAHTRDNGADVRTHYRGSRDFIWNGYRVTIVMPEKHGAPQASFNLATVPPTERAHLEALGEEFVDTDTVDLSHVFGHHTQPSNATMH